MAIYEVNYTISNAFTVYVEATSPEEAQEIIENVYQNNFDLLPEDGELDHDIDPGILVEEKLAKNLVILQDELYTREDMTNE